MMLKSRSSYTMTAKHVETICYGEDLVINDVLAFVNEGFFSLLLPLPEECFLIFTVIC